MTDRWGPPTWFFFHCFAEKINDDFYEKEYKKCFNIIKSVCASLPCPVCQRHAMTYLKRVNVHSLRKKDDFKRFLFNFHNYANVNTKKKTENINILQKYEKGIFINISKYFFQNFYSRQLLLRNFSMQMYEKKILKEIKDWLTKNIGHFSN